MGVAVSADHAPDDITALLSQADQGLYAAKRHGRDRVMHVGDEPADLTTKVVEKAKSAEGTSSVPVD